MTHSYISYLDKRGEDLGAVYDHCDWPPEFLRDASSWMEASKVEMLLASFDRAFGQNLGTEFSLAESVGHQSKDLRSWGVLDSVLRMVQAPKDLFAQPERFLSYFVSPAPPVGEVRRGADFVSFVLPVSEVQFPFSTAYLKAALESLPTYINKPMATVTWVDSRVTITWSEDQTSLFNGDDAKDLSLHPELVRNILVNLEASQKELEAAKKQLVSQAAEIEQLKDQNIRASKSRTGLTPGIATEAAAVASPELSQEISDCLHDVFRLGDYFARGQQLITLLVAQGRQTPQVQEAMRRVDWTLVSERVPQVLKHSMNRLQDIQEMMDGRPGRPLVKTPQESIVLDLPLTK